MPAKPAITPIFCRRNNVILDWSLCSVTCINSGNYMNATNNSCTNALFRNFKFMNRLLHSWRFWRRSLVLAAIGNCNTKYIKRLGTSNEERRFIHLTISGKNANHPFPLPRSCVVTLVHAVLRNSWPFKIKLNSHVSDLNNGIVYEQT